MVKKFQALDTHHLKTAQLQPLNIPAVIHLDDPADYVFNNYRVITPRVLSSKKTIIDAEELLKTSRSHLLLVEDESHHIIGVLRTQDVFGDKSYKEMSEHRIKRERVSVSMIMMPLHEVIALPLESLKHAKVGNIIETFKIHERAYALVYEAHESQSIICGSFSLAQICKMMGESTPSPDSIAELQKKLEQQ